MGRTRIRYYLVWGIVVWWTVSLAAGCRMSEPGGSIPTPEVSPVSAAMPEPTLTLAPTPALTLQLQAEPVVLHTNDNWGETAPCG